MKKHRTRQQCEVLIPRLLRAIPELQQVGLAQLVTLGETLSSWWQEIIAMWRFTRNNGITDGKPVWWIPIAAPLLGGLIGAAIYDFGIRRFLPRSG